MAQENIMDSLCHLFKIGALDIKNNKEKREK